MCSPGLAQATIETGRVALEQQRLALALVEMQRDEGAAQPTQQGMDIAPCWR